MNLKSGDKVPNLGCGVGGSLRRIAYLTGAYVTDITISDYQIQRAKKIGSRRPFRHKEPSFAQLIRVISLHYPVNIFSYQPEIIRYNHHEQSKVLLFCGLEFFKSNIFKIGNDSAIRRKNSCSKGRSSYNDISRTHVNKPPGKLFVTVQ
ncbi:unnamed protein product [Rotaria sp. Silwood2]|nr:unnamed protein product [Rotaria sp. Silwood2]CAF4505212.1 unnamed protein product [Rotaria sp. Silwood2]CAF4521395.1 unnamed protein product [Rotaria sp. Silwood2]CAF4567329.1 unnamed protein product [Rotaria sp. Silwood2]